MASNELVIRINGNAKKFLDEIDKVQKKTKDLKKSLTTVAKSSAVTFAGFAASIALITKEFAKYETALVGVGKTTDIEGKKLEKFGKEFQKLSGEIPVATNELLGIAQAAGQLGVKGEKNILKFTKTIARLGVATDLSGENAALTLAKILSITNEGVGNVDRFGASIVALGNEFEATESQIARNTQEVAKSTAAFNIGATNAAALGTVLKSLGQEAQLGGSVVGKTFLKIQKAISEGGKKAELLTKLTGIAGSQLQQTFAKDATKVFQLFLEGVGKVDGGTAGIFATLEKFGLKGDEVNKVLPVLAKNYLKVNKAVNLSSKAYKENTALLIESDKAFATLTSEGTKLKNTLTTLAVQIGAELAPTFKEIIVDVRKFVQRLNENNGALAKNIASFIKWGAIISGVVASIAAFLLGAIQLSAVITALGAAFLPATIAASSFWVAVTGPIGVAVAGLALATGAVIAFANAADNVKPDSIEDINKEIEKLEGNIRKLEKLGVSRRRQEEIKAIKEEIDALKKLKNEKIANTDTFGTGQLLLRPKVDAGIPDLGNVFQQNLVLKTDQQLGDEAAAEAKTKAIEEKKTAIVSAETQKRIEKLKLANQQLVSLEQAKNDKLTQEEQTLATRRAEIENEFVSARRIVNNEERSIAIQNLQLKHGQELSEITQQSELLALQKEEDNARQLELDQALRDAKVANTELFTTEDEEALRGKLLTEDEIKQEQALADAERVIRERNQFLESKVKFNSTVAKLDTFAAKEKVKAASELSSNLLAQARAAGEQNSALGKAAALTQIAINTPEAASSNYKFASKLGGPIAGTIAAGIAFAFGAKQAEQVLAANSGGVVPATGRAGVDSVPAMLTPGELVVPTENFNEVIDSVASQRGFVDAEQSGSAESGNQGTVTVILEPAGDFIDMIEQKQIEAEIQNTGVR